MTARALRGLRALALVASASALRAQPPRLQLASGTVTVERPGPLAAAADAYLQLTATHYVPCAIVQAGVLTSGADVITQCMHGLAVADVDMAHVAAMGTVAASLSGGANACWLRMLERRYPGAAPAEVQMKTFLHFSLVAAFINAHYLMAVPALSAAFAGEGLPAGVAALGGGFSAGGFAHLMGLELGMFVPYNLLAFRVVPPRVRPLTAALLSATFSICVAALTLGYGDVFGDAFGGEQP